MHHRTRTYVAPFLMAIPLLVGIPASVEAGFLKIWQLKETAAAPVLVVGRVLGVEKRERVPDGSLPWKAETWAMTAEVEVLRSYTGSGEAVAVNLLPVSFWAYGPSVTQIVNGYPPPLPHIEPGQVLIFPLRENRNPASELWRLTADSGADLTIPARAGLADFGPPPATERPFLVREIANTLSRGTPREVFAIAGYLAGQNEDLIGELMPLLEPAIGQDRQRWAEVAANLLAAQGVPRPAVADLLSGKAEPKDWPLRPSLFLAQTPLRKLKASPETDALLIETWIAGAPWNAWGSANSLIEYGSNPVTTQTLRHALDNDLAGSSYIALVLARNGNRAILPAALARALKVADRPNAGFDDLQGAAALLRDYGSDRELKQLADLVRKYQTLDTRFYNLLWQDATYSGTPREARVLAVVLRDRRTAFDDTRYCDLAVGVLEKAAGQHFGAGGKTPQERDGAVSRALAWIASQDLKN
ncbi:MAG TPA: hypothetical protein VNY05_02460 [Candidatus Acidoferrales bacterium]|nr:hypothetical protein [Candidatus Acidoferrales bacterium]